MDDPQADAPRFSLRACLKHFIHACKMVATLCMNISDSMFFRPSKSSNLRLKCVGITNFVPCINSVALYPSDVASQMLFCLVQLKGHLTKYKLAQLRAGTFTLEPSKLVLRGCPAWRKISKVNVALPSGADLLVPPAGHEVATCQPVRMSLCCPECLSSKEVACISLFRHGRWKQLHCLRCSAFFSSRRWTCTCGSVWCGCALHAASGFLCGSRKRGFAPRSVHEGGVACGHEGTNHIAPPSVDDSCPSKRPRHLGTGRSGRQSVLKRRLSYAQPPDRSRPVPRVTSTAECSRPASASSSSQPAVAPAVSASLERGTKRKAGVPHRIRPKPKARSTGLDAIEAFRRLQAARADPLAL